MSRVSFPAVIYFFSAFYAVARCHVSYIPKKKIWAWARKKNKLTVFLWLISQKKKLAPMPSFSSLWSKLQFFSFFFFLFSPYLWTDWSPIFDKIIIFSFRICILICFLISHFFAGFSFSLFSNCSRFSFSDELLLLSSFLFLIPFYFSLLPIPSLFICSHLMFHFHFFFLISFWYFSFPFFSCFLFHFFFFHISYCSYKYIYIFRSSYDFHFLFLNPGAKGNRFPLSLEAVSGRGGFRRESV